MKLIPKLIRPYFKLIRQSEDADNSLVEGKLTCCTVHDFEIFIVGNIKRCLFSKRFLYSENDEIVLEARCKRCDKIISVFNSSIEGYRNLGVTKKTYVPPLDILIAKNVEMIAFLLLLNMNIRTFKNCKKLKSVI